MYTRFAGAAPTAQMTQREVDYRPRKPSSLNASNVHLRSNKRNKHRIQVAARQESMCGWPGPNGSVGTASCALDGSTDSTHCFAKVMSKRRSMIHIKLSDLETREGAGQLD